MVDVGQLNFAGRCMPQRTPPLSSPNGFSRWLIARGNDFVPTMHRGVTEGREKEREEGQEGEGPDRAIGYCRSAVVV